MALTLGDNFSYLGAKPLDGRIQYSTVAAMAAMADSTLYDGCIAYCSATDKNYQWKSGNSVDPTTGKWRELETGGGGGGGSEATVLTGTLTAAGWSNKSQTATVTGLLATDNGVIGALNTATTAQLEAMRDAVLSVSTVANGAVTFSCEETPSIDIPFGVLIGGGGSGGGSLPTGGTTGQVLTKKSSTDGDADWEDPASGGHTIVNSAGTSMASEDKLKFVGATVTDDSTNGQTVVTVDEDTDKLDSEILYPAFDSTATYAIGDKVTKDGKAYEFTAAHTGAWAAADVDEIDVGEFIEDMTPAEVQAVKDAFTGSLQVPFATTMDVIDFRGTERVVGKVILANGAEKVMYEKSFDVGQLPNAVAKEVTHGISNLDTVIDIFGSYKGGGYFGTMQNVCEHGVATDYSIRIFCDTTNITIKTGSDFSNYTGYVTLRYTKSA